MAMNLRTNEKEGFSVVAMTVANKQLRSAKKIILFVVLSCHVGVER
jgi:hypothetical protein